MKKNKRENLVGVPPDQLTILKDNGREFFITHKSAKKGKVSFLITKALLENLWATSLKINKQPKLIISIPTENDEFILTATLTKQSR
jgi:hypothetical protein